MSPTYREVFSRYSARSAKVAPQQPQTFGHTVRMSWSVMSPTINSDIVTVKESAKHPNRQDPPAGPYVLQPGRFTVDPMNEIEIDIEVVPQLTSDRRSSYEVMNEQRMRVAAV